VRRREQYTFCGPLIDPGVAQATYFLQTIQQSLLAYYLALPPAWKATQYFPGSQLAQKLYVMPIYTRQLLIFTPACFPPSSHSRMLVPYRLAWLLGPPPCLLIICMLYVHPPALSRPPPPLTQCCSVLHGRDGDDKQYFLENNLQWQRQVKGKARVRSMECDGHHTP